MVTKFKLLNSIHTNTKELLEHSQMVMQRLDEIHVLGEDVTHVLANIATKAGAGEEIQAASAASLASFMAGVELIAQRLPLSSDEHSKKSVLSVMANMQINPDGTITTNVQPVAEYGARKNPQAMKKYETIFTKYEQSLSQGAPDGVQLVQAARRLQVEIDRALRMAMAARGVSNRQTVQ